MVWEALSPEDSAEWLAPRVFRPKRHQGVAAREVVRGHQDPAEAWEALAAAGMIPVDWVGDPTRRFGKSECDNCTARAWQPPNPWGPDAQSQVCFSCGAPGIAAYPRTMSDVVALASDPNGVVTAENLAREWFCRLGLATKPWSRTVWHALPRRVLRTEARSRMLDQNRRYRRMDPVETAICVAWAEASSLFESQIFSWSYSALGYVEINPDNHRGLSPGLFVGSLQKTKTLWRALLATGYIVDSVCADTIVMAMPVLES